MKRKALDGLAHFFLVALLLVMPTQGKRLMYLASLNFYLIREGVFKQTSLEEFNYTSVLNLPIEAFQLPRMAMSLIWDRTELMDVVIRDYDTNNDCPKFDIALAVSKHIVEITPTWLKYPHRQMTVDTMQLFYQSLARKAALPA